MCFLFILIFLILAGIVKIEIFFIRAALSMLLFLIVFILIFCIPAQAYEYTPNEMVSIGKVVHHEAGNQSELGKRLVIDTILNRVESSQFPNTVDGVLGQKGQYCDPDKYPPKDIYKLIAEEIYERTNSDVLWYRTKQYHKYGTPIIQEGSHYFSGGE